MICEKHNTPMVDGKSYEVLAMPAGTPCPFCECDVLRAALERIDVQAPKHTMDEGLTGTDAIILAFKLGKIAREALRGTERTAAAVNDAPRR